MSARARRATEALATAASVLALGGCGGGDPEDVATTGREPVRTPPAGTLPAPASFTRACARAAASPRQGAVRPAWRVVAPCPSLVPVGGFERPRQFGVPPCAPLLDVEPRGLADRPGAVFHLLLGRRCAPWDLRVRDGRWPARAFTAAERRDGQDLRLAGALRLLRRTTVRGAPALVLQNPPYPTGGIHGGHVTVLWNAAGHGAALSGHPVGDPAAADRAPSPAEVRAAADVLRAVAASAGP